MLKFLIADDHPLFRDALKGALQSAFNSVSFIESDSLETTISALRDNRKVSVVILDLTMPGCDNFYGLLRVRESFPNVPVLVLSASDSPETVSQVIAFGASGFVSKASPVSEVKTAIEICLGGGEYIPEELKDKVSNVDIEAKDIASKLKELTPKQFQVLRHVKNGMMNKQIADTLNVTEATVKAHIGVIFKKLNVKTRTQIVLAVEKLQFD
ncbi:response regulator transcription factor [Glaciecola sp. KUL10]|uniref:response regulator transcription factor n=1 Tax=Glaciecola sp. (strain KUL10) TaxID=2161813 RepID=UPI000D7865F5|nr:response regulator transcription factor [Glaciecola sp. KUL10]GBL03011.1 two component LuxR family transcriptional regulator [Glaciecola sp. KUL10]